MFIPVAGVSLLLALLADAQEPLPRSIRTRAKKEGWLPKPGELDVLRVPRLWFDQRPDLVPAPFVWPSDRSAGWCLHPYRTMHLLMNPDEFLEFTSTDPELLRAKSKHMQKEYLPIARRMMTGEEPLGFPPPYLQIGYEQGAKSPQPHIIGHEGRHRALMAKMLGLPVIPVVLIIRRDPEGWEHSWDSIEQDYMVDWLTRGSEPLVYTQDHGPESTIRPRWKSMISRSSTGQPLGRELVRLKLTLDPSQLYSSR